MAEKFQFDKLFSDNPPVTLGEYGGQWWATTEAPFLHRIDLDTLETCEKVGRHLETCEKVGRHLETREKVGSDKLQTQFVKIDVVVQIYQIRPKFKLEKYFLGFLYEFFF